MAMWQQQPGTLGHATQWTVVIDPPDDMCTLRRFSSRALADVYMRNLSDNNPRAREVAHIIAPAGGRS